jgi:hypothetical protein
MGSQRVEIRSTTLEAARKDAAAGGRREIVDIGGHGLVLRVQPSGCVWQVRVQHKGKPYRVTLGPLDLWPLGYAREAAQSVRWHITTDHGVPDAYWMKSMLDRLAWQDRNKGKAAKDPSADPEPHHQIVRAREERVTTWSYLQARTAWGRHLEGEAKVGNLTPETVRNYTSVVGCPAMRELDLTPVARITDVMFDKVVKKLVLEGKRSQANDVVRVGKRMWNWLYEPANREASGVARGVLADVKAPSLGDVKKRQRFPALERLGLVVATTRSGALDPVISAALHLLAWTAQRRLTIARAHVEEFAPWAEREGWGLWRVGHRKAHDDQDIVHTIPLPPSAWAGVLTHVAWLKEHEPTSSWLFPSRREAKAGVPARQGHLDVGTITKSLPTIPGAGMTPHDVRRCFPSTLSKHGHHLTFIGYILDHLSLGSTTTRDENRMTRRYTDDEMLHFKVPVMETWQALLEPAAQAATLLPMAELRAEIIRLRDEQRGLDKSKEKARLRRVNAERYAAGMTPKQRRRAAAA